MGKNKDGKDKKEKGAAGPPSYYEKVMASNKLVNEESNRLISWALSVIGGTILTVIGTNYVQPTGNILYAYFLFIAGWLLLALSIYYGELITRIYIAGVTVPENNTEDISIIGAKVDEHFDKQIKLFIAGIVTFSLWLVLFLFWFILFKN